MSKSYFISTVEKFELSILCTQIMFLKKGRLSKKNCFIIIILNNSSNKKSQAVFSMYIVINITIALKFYLKNFNF